MSFDGYFMKKREVHSPARAALKSRSTSGSQLSSGELSASSSRSSSPSKKSTYLVGRRFEKIFLSRKPSTGNCSGDTSDDGASVESFASFAEDEPPRALLTKSPSLRSKAEEYRRMQEFVEIGRKATELEVKIHPYH